jgi:hypothetical protein
VLVILVFFVPSSMLSSIGSNESVDSTQDKCSLTLHEHLRVLKDTYA